MSLTNPGAKITGDITIEDKSCELYFPKDGFVIGNITLDAPDVISFGNYSRATIVGDLIVNSNNSLTSENEAYLLVNNVYVKGNTELSINGKLQLIIGAGGSLTLAGKSPDDFGKININNGEDGDVGGLNFGEVVFTKTVDGSYQYTSGGIDDFMILAGQNGYEVTSDKIGRNYIYTFSGSSDFTKDIVKKAIIVTAPK